MINYVIYILYIHLLSISNFICKFIYYKIYTIILHKINFSCLFDKIGFDCFITQNIF